mmetsp:Transcript_47315/g.150752  ORF Transcript_47315/g.150752 Transcript_47315/m.150752 type:complete len:507 (+) Transcript_47315:99-1619(+)
MWDLLASARSLVLPSGAGSVDLVVRSYALELATVLPPLLRSVELFWPEEWGVVVVLDAESATDRLLGSQLPSYVRVAYEEKPKGFGKWFTPVFSTSYLRAVYSFFTLDRYTRAEFVALVDADMVLSSAAQHRILFEQRGTELMPIVHGSHTLPVFVHCVKALLMEWVAEFMDSVPFVFRTRDLASIRAFVQGQLGFKMMNKLDFADVFYELIVRTTTMCRNQTMHTCIPIFHSIAGHWMFWHQRDSYAWSLFAVPNNIREAAALDPRDACPALQGAVHIPYQGIYASRVCGDQSCIFSRVTGQPWRHKAPTRQSVLEHDLHAAAYIRAGECAMRAVLPQPTGTGAMPPWHLARCAEPTLPPCVFLKPAWLLRPDLRPRLRIEANSTLEGVFASLGCGDRVCAHHFNDVGCPPTRTLEGLRAAWLEELAREASRRFHAAGGLGGVPDATSSAGALFDERPAWWPTAAREMAWASAVPSGQGGAGAERKRTPSGTTQRAPTNRGASCC